MLTELRGKGGRICQPALDGELRCPLIVRPSSEDVVTGQVFQALQAIDPRWWLPQILNVGLKADRFRSQVFRDLNVKLWQKQTMPRELVPWDEGPTEVDVVIEWENPRTTVYIEAKYRSDLSPDTTHNTGLDGYPSDQLIRNARVGLYRTGWYQEQRLFESPRRDFVLLLLNAEGSHAMVDTYRCPVALRRAIPKSHRIESPPATPFIGCLGYRDIISTLREQRRWMTRAERIVADQLCEYLTYKLDQMKSLRAE